MSVSLLFRHRQGPPRFLVTFLLSMVLSTLGLSAFAQGHPTLKAEDFTMNVFKGNTSCDTPGVLRITYANRVPGFTKLTYKFTVTDNSNTEFPIEVSNTNVGQPFDITLPANVIGYAKDYKIEVAADYGGATPETTELQFYEDLSASSFERTFLYLSSGGGGCSYELIMPPYPLTGVKELRYKIYDSSNTVINSGTTTEPYKEHKFPVSSEGYYTYDVTVVPDCTNPTKEPTNSYGNGNWDGNNFVDVNWNVSVSSNWYVSTSASVTLTNCVEKAEAELSIQNASGISSITYELRKYGETALFKTETSTAAPDFKVTIPGLTKEQQYEITAITDCGTSTTTQMYVSANMGISSDVKTSFANCVLKASVDLSTYGADGISSMNYEIRKQGETAVFKTAASTAAPDFKVTVEDLPEGSYEVLGITNCNTKIKSSISVSSPASSFWVRTGREDYFYKNCPGVITAEVSRVPEDVDVVYEVTYNGQVLATQTAKGKTKVRFQNLPIPEGVSFMRLKITANVCGKVETSDEYLNIYDYPSLSIEELVKPSGICVADGSVKVQLWNASPRPGTLEVYSGGNLHTESVNKGWSSTTLTGLTSGDVVAKFVPDCGDAQEVKRTLIPQGWSLDIEVKDGRMRSYCVDNKRYVSISLDRITNSNLSKEQVKQVKDEFAQGTYEVYQGSTLVASGNYADIPSLGILMPGVGKYRLYLRSHCTPSVVLRKDFEVKEPIIKITDLSMTPSSGCVNSGRVSFSVSDQNNTMPDQTWLFSGYYSWELFKEGVPYDAQKFTEAHNRASITKLPAGKYKLRVFVTCDPSISATKEFEIEGALTTPPITSTYIRQLCGSLKGRVRFYLPNPSTDVTIWDLELVRKSDNAVFYKGKTDNSDFKIDLPAGDYRLSYMPIGACDYPVATHDFTLQSETDLSKIFNFEAVQQEPATLSAPDGVVYLRLNSRTYDSDPTAYATFKLVSLNGGSTYTRRAVPGSSVYFYGLAPGRYKAVATFEGKDCELTTEVQVGIKNMEGRNHPDMACPNSNTPLGIVVTMNPEKYDFSGKTLTFKVYKRTAPGASTFTTVASKTEASGKTWTYFPGVLDNQDYSLFQTAVELNGRELYREEVKKPSRIYLYKLSATATPTQIYNHVDKNLGTITVSIPFNSPSYPEYTMPFSGTHTWKLKHQTSQQEYTKTAASPFAMVTFDNLPEGEYAVTYSYDGGSSCTQQKYTQNTTAKVTSGEFALMTSVVATTCEHNASITAQVRDVVGIQFLTYRLTSVENSYDETQTVSPPNVSQPISFPNLAKGKYELSAEALYNIGGTPITITRTIDVGGTTPIMNIAIDPMRTRPSLKNCPTGYFAFKYADDVDANSSHTPKTIDDSYQFSIIEAPTGSGITVPMQLERNNPVIVETYYVNPMNTSKLMNFPPGKYKFRVVNLCKTYDFEYTLLDTGKHKITPGRVTVQCEPDGKYRITGVGVGREEYIYWKDQVKFSITSSSGVIMPPTPYEEVIGREIPFHLDETYEVKASALCPGIPELTETTKESLSYSLNQECGNTVLTDYYSGNAYQHCEPRTLLVEDLDAPAASRELYRDRFYGYYSYKGNSHVKFSILDNSNTVRWTQTINPYPEAELSTYRGRQKCDVRSMEVYTSNGCPGTVFFKIYRGIGAAKESQPFYESKQLEKEHWFDSPLFKDYTVESYNSSGVLLETKTFSSGGYTIISDFELYNKCGYNNSSDGSKYEVEYVRFKYPPLDPGTTEYYLPETTFSFVRGDTTFVAELGGGGTELYSRPAGTYSDYYSLTKQKYLVYGTTQAYNSWDSPSYYFGETVSGTYTQCDGKITRTISGIAQLNAKFNVNIEDGWSQTCDGWNLVVPDKAYYKDAKGVRRMVNVTGYDYTNPVTGVRYQSSTLDGRPLPVPQGQQFNIELYGLPCNFTSNYRPNRVEHKVDVNKSLSFYCTATGKGKHYIEAMNGTPPYTYTFYDRPKESSGAVPIPSTPGAPNPQTSSGIATFDYGVEGGTYMVEITDACGNLTIKNNTTVLSVANLTSKLGRTATYCSGEDVTFVGQSFPVAAYKWTLPTGSARTLTPTEEGNRILTLNNIQPSDAGVYTLDISPNDCSTNFRMTFTLNVDHIVQPTAPAVNQAVCKGTSVTLSPGASTAESNGTAGSVAYQWYESRDGANFTAIAGETNDSYTYVGQQVGPRYFKREDSYKNCKKETPVNLIVVNETPTQTFKPSELIVKARRNQKFTLPEGRVMPIVGVTYLWERSDDGVSGWTPVGTYRELEETTVFPSSQKQVFYRRTATLGSCSSTSPNIQVKFSSSFAPMINPHLRLRVKK